MLFVLTMLHILCSRGHTLAKSADVCTEDCTGLPQCHRSHIAAANCAHNFLSAELPPCSCAASRGLDSQLTQHLLFDVLQSACALSSWRPFW